MSLGEGLGLGSGGCWGVVRGCLWQEREKGTGGGEGGGGDLQRNRQVNAHVFVKSTL